MSQSRRGSLLEACANITVGAGINFAANLLILPRLGFVALNLRTNLELTVIFTAISLVRSYILRRTFDGIRRFDASR